MPKNRRTYQRLIAAIIVGIIAAGCDTVELHPFPEQTKSDYTLTEGTWQLVGLKADDDYRNVSKDVNAEVNFTTEVDEEEEARRVEGNGGCNGFSGLYRAEKESLSVVKLIKTEIWCGKEINEIEKTFVSILANASRFKIHHRELRIYGENENIAVFTTQSK